MSDDERIFRAAAIAAQLYPHVGTKEGEPRPHCELCRWIVTRLMRRKAAA